MLTVVEWSIDDVCLWLDRLGLTEYRNVFTTNDIRGQELVSLSRIDLKVSRSGSQGNGSEYVG